MPESEVLIVDDCRMTTLLLRYILNEEGIATATAASGLDGLRKATENEYRLVLLDIVLPGMDGIQVARRIRETRRDRSPEIILMTGMGEKFDPEMVSQAGAREVFFKPIAPSRVAEVARRLTHKEPAP